MQSNNVLVLGKVLRPPAALAWAEVNLGDVFFILSQQPKSTDLAYSLNCVLLLYFHNSNNLARLNFDAQARFLLSRRHVESLELLVLKA